MNKIIFFHDHVNGDCFFSRLLVNKIIQDTKNRNIEYFYTAPNAVQSHCEDINISEHNFNVIQVPHYNDTFYLINGALFINVWIGNTIIEKKICAFCLNGVIINYNRIIELLNNSYNLNISLIDNNSSPYIDYNFTYYSDTIFIKSFIESKKNIYDKIILICNTSPSTFISLRYVTRRYLYYLVNKHPNYLFITFHDTLLKDKFLNIISLNDIYNINNKKPQNSGAIFSFISTIADKVILLPSGLSLTCFNNINDDNKFMMLFDHYNNPAGCPYCETNFKNEYLCTSRFDWYIKMEPVDLKDENINNNLCVAIEDFIIS
jgi:hypothetical protein